MEVGERGGCGRWDGGGAVERDWPIECVYVCVRERERERESVPLISSTKHVFRRLVPLKFKWGVSSHGQSCLELIFSSSLGTSQARQIYMSIKNVCN